jgi:hypothetical protein
VQKERGKEVHELGGKIDLHVEISKFGHSNFETKCQLLRKSTFRYVRFRSLSTFDRTFKNVLTSADGRSDRSTPRPLEMSKFRISNIFLYMSLE